MQPEEFQDLAEKLVGASDPASLRSAMSRSYYAVYHVAREFFEQIGFPLSEGPRGHGEATNNLALPSLPKEVRAAGCKLQTLHGVRIDADYRLIKPKVNVEDQATATTHVELAKRTIREMKEFWRDPIRNQIIAAVQTYQRQNPPSRR